MVRCSAAPEHRPYVPQWHRKCTRELSNVCGLPGRFVLVTLLRPARPTRQDGADNPLEPQNPTSCMPHEFMSSPFEVWRVTPRDVVDSSRVRSACGSAIGVLG